jgi:hypothetical protein
VNLAECGWMSPVSGSMRRSKPQSIVYSSKTKGSDEDGVVSFGDQEEAPASFSAAAVFSTSIIVQDITPSKTRGPPLDVRMHLLA